MAIRYLMETPTQSGKVGLKSFFLSLIHILFFLLLGALSGQVLDWASWCKVARDGKLMNRPDKALCVTQPSHCTRKQVVLSPRETKRSVLELPTLVHCRATRSWNFLRPRWPESLRRRWTATTCSTSSSWAACCGSTKYTRISSTARGWNFVRWTGMACTVRSTTPTGEEWLCCFLFWTTRRVKVEQVISDSRDWKLRNSWLRWCWRFLFSSADQCWTFVVYCYCFLP